MKKLYIPIQIRKISLGGGGMSTDIDERFAEFVQKNYQKLTENQKKLCEQMGVQIPS